MRGKGEVDVESRAEWGLRCRTGAWTSAGRGAEDMFGTRYYYFGLRGVGGKRLRALKGRNGFSPGATSEGEFPNVTRSYAGKGIVRYVW